jgi:hypothetical protein
MRNPPAQLLPWSLALLIACAGGEDERIDPSFVTTSPTDSGDPTSCIPGAQNSCACAGGGQGIQVCEPDGASLGPCECDSAEGSATNADGSDDDPTGFCGDAECGDDETCDSCAEDCGECVPCTAAPSCDGAEVPPVITDHADELDNIELNYVEPEEALQRIAAHVAAADSGARLLAAALAPSQSGEHRVVTRVREVLEARPEVTAALRRQLAAAGMEDPRAYRDAHEQLGDDLVADGALARGGMAQGCDDPRLRIRVARLDVIEEDDDFANDEVYCAITSEASQASEIRVTPMTPPLDEGDSEEYSLAEGVVWGQQGLASPMGGIALTYNCIESDSANGFADLLDAIRAAAEQAGAIAGDSGWIFDAIGIVADLLSAALSLDSDDQLFNASHVVPEDMHLALTQGAYWEVHRSGTNLNSDWDWLLRMEIWGCHDNAQ